MVSLQRQPPQVFFKISQNSQEDTCARVSSLKKEIFPCEFFDIFQNTFLTKHLRETTSEVL